MNVRSIADGLADDLVNDPLADGNGVDPIEGST